MKKKLKVKKAVAKNGKRPAAKKRRYGSTKLGLAQAAQRQRRVHEPENLPPEPEQPEEHVRGAAVPQPQGADDGKMLCGCTDGQHEPDCARHAAHAEPLPA